MKWLRSRSFKTIMLAILGIVVAIVSYGLLQLIEPVELAPIATSSPPIEFAGRALLVASDADMVATAYADGKLDRVAGVEDTLSVIQLPIRSNQASLSSIQVSNSVMSWPQIMAVSPNGKRAYIVEVRSRPANDIQAFDNIDQMPDGQQLTVVDIADLTRPKVLESIAIGRNPEHISISPDGRFLAVNLEEPGRELAIIRLLADGRLGKQWFFPMSAAQNHVGNYAAIWHPSGNYLAMTQDRDRQIGFYAVNSDPDGEVSVTPYGQPLTVGNHLSHARFTTAGRFLLVPDLKWRTQGIRALNFLLNPRGEMIAIRFEPESGKPPAIASRVEVGLSPEGFALNPDNTLIATVNMRRTYFSPNFPPFWRGKPYSSLSLVQFAPKTGQLTTLGEYGFEGLLPEQVTFDTNGKSLAVVIYNYREQSPRKGTVEFWRVVSGNQPKLERTGFKLDVVRGAHDIVLVP
jgi:DNA-binding beta-propeller fold protein YncE